MWKSETIKLFRSPPPPTYSKSIVAIWNSFVVYHSSLDSILVLLLINYTASGEASAEITNTGSEAAAQQGQSSTDTPPSATEVTMTTTTTNLQSDDGTATPPVDAQLAAYSAYSGATSQGVPTSYVTAASSYASQPGVAATAAGAAQYSYAYGQGYGNYAAYAAAGAYAAYGGYPGQYYQGKLCI